MNTRTAKLYMGGCLALLLALMLGLGCGPAPAWAAGSDLEKAGDQEYEAKLNLHDKAATAALAKLSSSQTMLFEQLVKIAALSDGKAPDWSQMERIMGKMMESWPNTTRWLNLIKEENISPELLQVLAETIHALAKAEVEFWADSGLGAGHSLGELIASVVEGLWSSDWQTALARYNAAQRQAQALQNAIDALKGISAGNAETLAQMLQNLLDKAGEKGISQETLRDILTDMKNTDSNKWPALLAKYPGAGALANDLLALAKQVQGMNLGNQLPAADALALAEAVLNALEQGYSPQQLAEIKKLTDSGLSVTQALNLMQQRILTAEADLASLLPGAPVTALKNLDINLNIQALGDRLHPGNMQATIQGGLADYGSYGTGSYGFSVNLSSGAVSNGVMSHSGNASNVSFTVSGGSGSLSGNNFNLGGFTGIITDGSLSQSVSSATLNGAASKGFGNVGNIGATGDYDVSGIGGLSNGGTITSGERIQ